MLGVILSVSPALLLRLAVACGGSSWQKCQQVRDISIGVGRGECQYTRDFYGCLVSEGCYELDSGCLSATAQPVACSELCESEPGFGTCTAGEDEDFDLCPHVAKGPSTPAPDQAAYLAAPALPFTLTIWLDFEAGNVPAASVLLTLWPDILRQVLTAELGLNELAVVAEEPVVLREGPIALAESPAAPVWALHTYFATVRIHVLDATELSATRTAVNSVLTGGGSRLAVVEGALLAALTGAVPVSTDLVLRALELYVVDGRVEDLPSISTTSLVATTTPQLGVLARRKWRAWRVRCLQGIVHRWEVRELEFWTDQCPWFDGKQLLQPENGSVISSGAVDGFGASNAFDGRAEQPRHSWISSCSGCGPGEAWLGINALTEFAAVCAVVRQGDSGTGQCSHIAVEAADELSSWHSRGEVEGFGVERSLCLPLKREDYPLLDCGTLDDGCEQYVLLGPCPGSGQLCEANRCRCVARKALSDSAFAGWECGEAEDGCGETLQFGDCATGSTCQSHKCKLHSHAAAQWRLVCEAGTLGRWWVHEVEFHSELNCIAGKSAFQAALSSGTYAATYGVANAFDGDQGSVWGSHCNRCVPREAWLGVDFGQPVQIVCVLLQQDERSVQQCPQLLLEASDDREHWLEVERYGFGDHAIKASAMLRSDMDSLEGDDSGNLDRLALAWKLECAERLEQQWGVVDIGFYDDTDCINSLRPAVVEVLHARSSSWPIANALDGDAETLWRSACGVCSSASCKACEPHQAFVGVVFQRPVAVGCVVLEQQSPGEGGCSRLTLRLASSGDATEWSLWDEFSSVGTFALLVPRQANAGTRRRAAACAANLLALSAALLRSR